MTDQLPPGWELAKLEQVSTLHQGFGFPKDLQGKTSGDLAFFKVSDISRAIAAGRDTLDAGAHYISNQEAQKLRATPLPEGSVVFARIGEAIRLNRRALLARPALVDNNVIGTKAHVGIEDRYLLHFLQTVRLGDLSQATTVPAVRSSDIAGIEIPIPPTNEQQRIVSKLDELFSRIDEGERALERVQKLVERYRQSVLKAAVTGELTRDWREKNKDKLESGEALLARILKARREAWEKAELDKMKAKDSTPANDKWKLKYEEPTTAKIGFESCCPVTWAQPSLEQATRADRPIAYGVLQPGEDLPSGILMIRVCNVANGVVDQAELKRIAPEISDQFPRTLLRGGEVLLTLVGTIGRTAVVPKELAGANVARAVGVLSPVPVVLPDWLELCLRSEKTRQVLTDNAREVARKTLNLEQLREYAVPMPSVEEQHEAVSRVNELLSKANAAADAISKQVWYAYALRQATRRSAFSGELVPQNATDEPASELLQRIAADRNSAPAKPYRGRKPKTPEPA